jgi:hypothetical protein
VDGADTGTDVEHARSVDAFAPNDLDQLPSRGVQPPLAPSGQIGPGIETVVPETGKILVAAEPMRRVRSHRPDGAPPVNLQPAVRFRASHNSRFRVPPAELFARTWPTMRDRGYRF